MDTDGCALICICAILLIAIMYYFKNNYKPGEKSNSNFSKDFNSQPIIRTRCPSYDNGPVRQQIGESTTGTNNDKEGFRGETDYYTRKYDYDPYEEGPFFNKIEKAFGGIDEMPNDWNDYDYSQDYLPWRALSKNTFNRHQKWSDEILPFSQTSMGLDNMDEAVAMSLPRHGLNCYKKSSPDVVNPLFINEIGPDTMARNFKTSSCGLI